MIIRLLLVLVGITIGFGAPTLAQQNHTPDPQLAQQLEAIGKKNDEAFEKGDAVAVAALFTENAVLVTEYGPVYGRQAIEKLFTDHFKAWHYRTHTTMADQHAAPVIGAAGNEAWWFGAWSSTYQVQSGPPQQAKGYWSSVHVREGDTWKICMSTYNVTPAPPATPSPATTP